MKTRRLRIKRLPEAAEALAEVQLTALLELIQKLEALLKELRRCKSRQISINAFYSMLYKLR